MGPMKNSLASSSSPCNDDHIFAIIKDFIKFIEFTFNSLPTSQVL